MKKLDKLKLFSLAFILMGALVFVGIDFLEAKKKDPEGLIKWPGEVKILEDISESNNLYGVGDIAKSTYTNNVFIETKRGGKSTTYRFSLTIEPGDGSSIGFRYIEFEGSKVWAVEEKPCYFPDVTFEYCENPNYDYDAPLCMKDFLEFSEEIRGDFYHPHPDYLYLYLSVKVVCEIEDVGYDNVYVPGHVNLEITRYNHIQEPCDYHHSIVGHLDVPDPDGTIQIKKKYVADNDNTWIINVNGTFTFSELYWGWIKRGKGGKPKGANENKIPLQAKIPINFETEWTKIIVE